VVLYADGVVAASTTLGSSFSTSTAFLYSVPLVWSPSSDVNTLVSHNLMCAYAGDSVTSASGNSSVQVVSVSAFSGAVLTLSYSSGASVYDNTSISIVGTISVNFSAVVFSGTMSLSSVNSVTGAVTVLGSSSAVNSSGSAVFTVSTSQTALLGNNTLLGQYFNDPRISAVNSSGYTLLDLQGKREMIGYDSCFDVLMF
jgi:hypothetical protein